MCGSGVGICESDADCAPFSCLPAGCKCVQQTIPCGPNFLGQCEGTCPGGMSCVTIGISECACR
jgi:hypothetical protein